MARKSVVMMVTATAVSCLCLADSAGASCSSRPGTPDQVGFELRDSRDAQGQLIHEIIFRWRNTANNGEKVWWDTEITDGTGRSIGVRPGGGGRPSSIHHEVLYNAFLVAPRTTRCFRIRARTAPGTEGCVSANWSPWVCARSSAVPGDPAPPTGLGVE